MHVLYPEQMQSKHPVGLDCNQGRQFAYGRGCRGGQMTHKQIAVVG